MRKSHSPSPVTAAFDRGPAKYFHGRKQILHDFSKLATRAIQADSGTTILIQGAPGAGKTALLSKCEELARDRKWASVKIYSTALWDPNELLQSLKSKRAVGVEGGVARVGVPGIVEAEIKAERSPRTVMNLLRGGETPLLLTLDEAQVLGNKNLIPPDQEHTVVSVLTAIHNGDLGRPVILLAAGLGTTVNAFEKLGISRFAGDAFIELGSLSKEAERAVIRDWLKKDGKAQGDLTAWINAIAQETHGWPQHILSYVEPALGQLHADKRVMTTEGLNAVLEAGRRGRAAYYRQRAKGFSLQQRRSFAKLFTNVAYGGSLELEDIMMSLAQDHGAEKADELFHRAAEKGIIDERDGRYVIPIPSMHDWLVSNYARERISSPPETPSVPSTEDRNSGMDFGR